MHSGTVSSSASTPTTGKNKFEAQFSRVLKRPQPFPYGDSSGTTSTTASASGSGEGSGSSGIDSVPLLRQQGHRFRSDSGSNSDSRSRSRSLSPLRRPEVLPDQDELISSDDDEPSTTTKYRRLSDPSGQSRMETDSRKSPAASATSSRTYSRAQSSYHRHQPREIPVMTSSMHGTESVCHTRA
jgi:hypothetical protein